MIDSILSHMGKATEIPIWCARKDSSADEQLVTTEAGSFL